MLKKAGILTVGVSAVLLAAAPMASAGEAPDHSDNSSESHHNDGGISCSAEGGDIDSSADGDFAGISAPILTGNTGQALSCNDFLNHNLNGNEISVLSSIPTHSVS